MRMRTVKSARLLAAALLLAGSFFMTFPAHAAGKGHAGEHSKNQMSAGKDSFYVTMAPMILPVIDERGLQEVVSLVVAIEVKDEEGMQHVNDLAPKLNDAYMRALYGKIDGTVYRNGQFLDVTKLKAKLANATVNIMGQGAVKDVLIQDVNQRHFY